MSAESDVREPAPGGTALLRAVAESLFLIRKALEHGNVAGARAAGRRLLVHLEALPEDRTEYERLCELADRELAADPEYWARARSADER